ncbi:hypothetical protein GCM10027034_41480 [Ramlibacter solisilvae]
MPGLGLDLSGEAERVLLDEYRRLQPFADVRDTLARLRQRGVVTGILSNADPPMLEAAVRSAGLEGLLAHLISVDAVRKFKTAPEAYALGPRATGLAAQDILFVSSNGWDVLGAGWCGYRTFWVNRQQLPFETLDGAPERSGDSLAGVLSFFPA